MREHTSNKYLLTDDEYKKYIYPLQRFLFSRIDESDRYINSYVYLYPLKLKDYNTIKDIDNNFVVIRVKLSDYTDDKGDTQVIVELLNRTTFNKLYPFSL